MGRSAARSTRPVVLELLRRRDRTSRGDYPGQSHGIGNTIAIATCQDGRFTPQHFFRGPAEEPVAFFPDPDNPGQQDRGTRFWLRKAFLHKGRLYIFAHQVADPGSAIYNTKIIRVDNPLDSPTRWKYDILTLGVRAVR